MTIDIPGEIADWPMLQLTYRTDADRITDLLPPGLDQWGDPEVRIIVYQVPISGEPEYGFVTKIPATYRGVDGWFNLGTGIDQENAIFISRETNGQPKFPAKVKYFRLGDQIVARCTHNDITCIDFVGTIGACQEVSSEPFREHDWWIKVLRATGGTEKSYDFPPTVVDVTASNTIRYRYEVDGELVLRDSRWDPYTTLLPMRELVDASLVKIDVDFSSRTLTNAGELDPLAFWPYADTIGGSHWPGNRGGPRTVL